MLRLHSLLTGLGMMDVCTGADIEYRPWLSLKTTSYPVLPQISYWHSEQCNMINGTSGQMWAPFMTPQSSLEFFSPDACR